MCQKVYFLAQRNFNKKMEYKEYEFDYNMLI